MKQNTGFKLGKSLKDLEKSIKAYDKEKPDSPHGLEFLALSKAFEVSLEYAWKFLKAKVEDLGLEAYSPKDAVRQSSTVDLIKNPEIWIRAINARNESVHDYYSMSESDFVKLIKEFFKELKGLKYE
jgi:nucleotidyltransferase substrate binding protein (TIGR01987 family)